MRHLVCVSAESSDPRSPFWTSEASTGRWLVGGCWIIAAHAENRVRFSGIVGLFHLRCHFFKSTAVGPDLRNSGKIADASATKEEIRNGRISCQDKDGSGWIYQEHSCCYRQTGTENKAANDVTGCQIIRLSLFISLTGGFGFYPSVMAWTAHNTLMFMFLDWKTTGGNPQKPSEEETRTEHRTFWADWC